MNIERIFSYNDVASILADHALKVLLAALDLLGNKSSTSTIKCLIVSYGNIPSLPLT
jgi:hypothetical protein